MDRLLAVFLYPFPSPVRHMIVKDVKTFFRDTAQWSQLLIVGALVVIYIYNFSVLPLDRASFLSFYLQHLVSFLNLALACFVLAGMAVRFVFPAVSLEGRSFWIVKSAPISSGTFLWSKFWLGWMPLAALGVLLLEITNKILGVSFFMEALSLVTLFLATFGITSLAVNMGALYPKFHYDDVARISTSFGGVLYMILALGFVGVLMLAEARPAYLLVMRSSGRMALSFWDQVILMAGFSLATVAATIAFLLPARYGARALESLDADPLI